MGFIWIFIGPYLSIAVLASSNDPDNTSIILTYCFAFLGLLGLLAGIGLLFQYLWACLILRVLSWIFFVSLSGITTYMAISSISNMLKGKMFFSMEGLIYAGFILIHAIPFWFIAKYLKEIHTNILQKTHNKSLQRMA
ncbi:MAG: hypothetical protein HGA96_14735 [Desulfobulbaceae bacterium]|nr:hypothetical protein [Desulfobulbaceae bacterium]